MRRTAAPLLVLLAACAPTAPASAPLPDPPACAAPAQPYLRSTLYFGLTRQDGDRVEESEWRRFLDEQVTPRFPAGLTVWAADGRWRYDDGRVAAEPTRVLLLLHPDTPAERAAIDAIRAHYRQAFDQESVLWETAPACVAF